MAVGAQAGRAHATRREREPVCGTVSTGYPGYRGTSLIRNRPPLEPHHKRLLPVQPSYSLSPWKAL